DRRVGSDADDEREERDEGEAGRPAQHAPADYEILARFAEPLAAAAFVQRKLVNAGHLGFHRGAIAERLECRAACLLRRHAGCLELAGAEVEMELDLTLDVAAPGAVARGNAKDAFHIAPPMASR